MYLTSPVLRAEVNQQECAKLLNFKMEMRIIYKKRIRRRVQVLKEMSLDINHHITFSQIQINLSSNLFLWIMVFDQIYRKMKKEANVKHDLMKKILQTDFLKENLLKQDYEIENEHILYETKTLNVMKIIVDVHETECKLFTKDNKNIMKIQIDDYQLDGRLENNILTATNYFACLNLMSDKNKQNYLHTKGLIYQESRDNRYEDKLPRKFLLKFDTIDLLYNCDLLLSASEDINDLALISKYFKRRNVLYKVQKKFSWIESVEFVGNKLIIDWFLGGRRYLKFVATDVNTIDTGHPWSKLRDGSMHYTFSTLTVTHTKIKKLPWNPFEIDLSRDPNTEEEKITVDDVVKVRDLNYVMSRTKKKQDIYFGCSDLDIYIPNHLHFGAIIKALMKQINFQIRWHKLSYKEYKVQNRIKLPPKPEKEQTDPRDFNLILDMRAFRMEGEDKPVTK